MAMSHNSLYSYYNSIFSLAQHHKYSISEIEGLIPFERDLYMDMLIDHIRKMEEAKN